MARKPRSCGSLPRAVDTPAPGLRLRIPHRFTLRGQKWRVRYGDPTHEALNAKREWGACIYTERTIYLNPELRRREHRVRLLDTFVHELLHAIDESAPKKGHWRKLSHGRIDSLGMELGIWLAENETELMGNFSRGPGVARKTS